MRKKRAMALLLIAPLAIFLLLIFVVPIGALLTRAVENPEVANALPHTVAALARMGPQDAAARAAYAALARTWPRSQDGDGDGRARPAPERGDSGLPLARHEDGARACRSSTTTASRSPRRKSARSCIELDERWGDIAYWQAIAKNGAPLFAVLPARLARSSGRTRFGHIERDGARPAIYLEHLRAHVRDRRAS